MIEENVLRTADHAYSTTTDSMLEMIFEAGFNPVQRSTLYEVIRMYERDASIDKKASLLLGARAEYIPTTMIEPQ
ncbi:Cyclic dehypoxanthine futalosine synthase [compost metagenome]